MKSEDFAEENVREAWGIESLDCRYESRHFGEAVDDDKNAVEAFADW